MYIYKTLKEREKKYEKRLSKSFEVSCYSCFLIYFVKIC